MAPRPADRARTPAERALSHQERSALQALWASDGRVVGRRELARTIGLADRNDRRCDSLVVGLRRALGADAIVTVRSRGWMLHPDARHVARSVLDANPVTDAPDTP